MKIVPILLVMMAACAVEDPGVDSTEQATSGTGSPCPMWGCGANSPILGVTDIHELNQDNVISSTYVELLGITVVGVNHMIDVNVVADQLTAVDNTVSPPVTYSGTALNGAVMSLLSYQTGGLKYGWIQIAHVTTKATSGVTFWVGPATPIETYELKANVTGTNVVPTFREHVCPQRAADDPDSQAWNAPFEAIIFTGDRYDSTTMKAYDTDYASSAGWFNIACAGSAIAKLHLNRHTTPGSLAATRTSIAYSTTTNERTAMLKMFVGDFCGNGGAFTQGGTPLYWVSKKGWTGQATSANTLSYESLWDETGALCMDMHRLLFSPDADYYYQGIINGTTNPPVAGVCPKVSCDSKFPSWKTTIPSTAYLRTQSGAHVTPTGPI